MGRQTVVNHLGLTDGKRVAVSGGKRRMHGQVLEKQAILWPLGNNSAVCY